MAREVQAGIRVQVDTKQGTSAVDSFASRFKQAFSGVGLATAVATKAVNLFQGALGKLTSIAKESIALANEQEKQQRRLAAALSIRGEATGGNIDRINQFNSAIQQNLGIGDEQLLQVQSTLSALGIQADRLRSATKATIGLAQITGDLNSASRLVGRALQGETSALTRYGIQADSVAEVQEKLNNLFELAEAQTGSYATQTARLDANIGDLGEAVGELITKNPIAIEQTSRLADATKGLEITIRDASRQWALFSQLRDEFFEENLPEEVNKTKSAFGGLLDTIEGYATPVGILNRTIDDLADRFKESEQAAADFEETISDVIATTAEADLAELGDALERSKKLVARTQKEIERDRNRANRKEVQARIKAEDEIADASAEASRQIVADTRARVDAEIEEIQRGIDARREMVMDLEQFLAELAFARFIREKEQREEKLEEGQVESDKLIEQQLAADEKREESATALAGSLASSFAGTGAAIITQTKDIGEAFEALKNRLLQMFAERAILGVFKLLLAPIAGPLGPIASFLGFQQGGIVPSKQRVPGFQAGGLVPGVGRGDRRLIAAEPGELVVRRELAPAAVAAGFGPEGMGQGGRPTVVIQQSFLAAPSATQMAETNRDVILPSLRKLSRLGHIGGR